MLELLKGFISKKLFVTVLTGIVTLLVSVGALKSGTSLHSELLALIPALAGTIYVIVQGWVDKEKVKLEATKVQAAALTAKDPS